MALKMNEIRAAEAVLFFLERFITVEIILHDKTPLLLAIDLLLLATTTILYAVPFSARQHLRRPYLDESDDDKLRYFCSERLGLLFVVLWMLGRCFYGLVLGRAVLIYTNLKYLFDYLEYIIAEEGDDDSDDDDDETQRQKGAEDYQVIEDNVSSNDEETQKREHSAEFPQVVIASFEDWLCVDVNGTQDVKNNDDEDEKENVDGDGDEEEEEDYEDHDIDYVDEGEEGEEDDSDSENGSNDGDGGEGGECDDGGGGGKGGGGEEDKDKNEEEEAAVDTENATEENKVQEELQEL